MEGNATEMFEEGFHDGKHLTEDFSLVDCRKQSESKMKIPQKSLSELAQEENELRSQWDKLKKENFCLQAAINAWQSTLKKKLDEFKEADLKLDEIHTEIWSEREKFCSAADRFNNDYGVLSEWWQAQMNFVSDLENLEEKRSENRKCREEIEKLEREIDEIKREMENLRTGKEIAEVEVHLTPEGDDAFVRSEHAREVSPERLEKKKIKISESEGQISEEIEGELFSLVDVEKVRAASRKNNRRKAFFGKFKQLLTK